LLPQTVKAGTKLNVHTIKSLHSSLCSQSKLIENIFDYCYLIIYKKLLLSLILCIQQRSHALNQKPINDFSHTIYRQMVSIYYQNS